MNRDTNWVNYLADLVESTLEAAAKMPKDEMLNAYYNNCQLTKLRPRGQVRWWNKGLAALRERTRVLLKRARKRNDPLGWQEYNRKRDQYREEIRKAQQTKWASFCEEVEGGAEAARLNKMLSSNPEAVLGPLKLPNGRFSTSDEETLNCLIRHTFPVSLRGKRNGRSRRRKRR